MSDKTIKYVDFEAVPINAVGDVVFCEIRRSSTFYGQETGPYKKARGILAHISGKTHGIILPLLPHRYEVLRLHIWTALP